MENMLKYIWLINGKVTGEKDSPYHFYNCPALDHLVNFLLALSLFAEASPTQEHRCLLDSETDISVLIAERMSSAGSFVISVTVAIRLI